jgi:hypothetical protein
VSSAAAGRGEQRREVKSEASFSWRLFTVEPGAPFSLVTFSMGEQEKVTGTGAALRPSMTESLN